MTKILAILALAASVTACTWDSKMYDSNIHHDMKKDNSYVEHSYGKYDYPPYRNGCPASHRSKGWC